MCIRDRAPAEEMNFITLLELINASEAREDDEEYHSPVDLLFADLEERDPDHFAVQQYRKYTLATFFISRYTKGYGWGIVSSLLSLSLIHILNKLLKTDW